jgi:lactase-phlorizin hydrolase
VLTSVAGSSDFFGLNHYTTRMVQHDENASDDSDVEKVADPSWSLAASNWLHVSTQYGSETLASYLLKINFPHSVYTEHKLHVISITASSDIL